VEVQLLLEGKEGKKGETDEEKEGGKKHEAEKNEKKI